jgi:ABC-2 type transport system ATP-binding protein
VRAEFEVTTEKVKRVKVERAKRKPAKPANTAKPAKTAKARPAVVEAHHLSLVGPEGPVFTDVSMVVRPGRLTVLVGPGGSGRSSLLLALSGRMRGCTGTLDAQGHPVRTGRDRRALRRRTALARISTLVLPEPRLTVAESVVERALVDGVRPVAAEEAFAAAEQLLDVHLDRTHLVERLTAYERSALAVALALVRPAEIVVVDDLDADLDLRDQRRFASALVRLAATGPAVLASTTELTSVPTDAVPVLAAPVLAAPQEP